MSLKKIGIYILVVYKTPTKYYFYIGQSRDIDYRIKSHLSALKNNRHYNKYLQCVFNKYKNIKNFYLKTCEIKNLNSIESYYLNKYKDNKYCTNLMPVIECDHVVPDNIRQKISISLKTSDKLLKGEYHKQAKLTEKEVLNIYNSRLSIKELSIIFKVNRSTIERILSGKSWKYLKLKPKKNKKILKTLKITKEMYNYILSSPISKSSAFLSKELNLDASYICKLRKEKIKLKHFKPS